jgi:demethylmenaquinone methyltransferase/2-methoxy-6-polyprenyl-1,4-benzoquinol methylase
MTSQTDLTPVPRERLGDALATPERKRRYVAHLFATIADRYDFITRLLSYGRDQHWKARMMETAAIRPGERVLDLACGTGDLTFAAAAHGATVLGLDLTPRMVQLAQQRAVQEAPAASHALPASASSPASTTPRSTALSGEPPAVPHAAGRVTFLVGDMTALPVATASIDVITIGYGLRNVPVLDEAIRETCRVLAPGGRLYSLDFNKPRQPALRAVYLAYLTVVGSLVGWLLHGDPDTYRYIPESIKRYPGAEAVVQRLRDAGFREARWQPVLGGLMAMHVARK